MAAPPIKFHLNEQIGDVATSDTASHVCEPSAAMNGQVVLVTGNWFACLSTDGGSSYKFINPFKSFPDPSGSAFCCDQVALFSEKFDRFFWLLQYTQNTKGENVQRIAHASTADARAGNWSFFDMSSKALGLPGAWLDFPDLAVGKTQLYMTTNAFRGDDWAGKTVIARIDIKSIIDGNVSADKFQDSIFNFRVAQNCDDTVVWGTHVTNSKVRIYTWKEADKAPKSFEVNVPTWSRMAATYKSLTPDGRNWLGRVDGRTTAAVRVKNELWLGWTAGAGGVNARPCPYVQVARIDLAAEKLIESINLWDPQHAVACSAFGADGNDDVGASYCYGGAADFPTHVVGYLTGTAANAVTFKGQRGPADEKWGDYLAVRAAIPAKDRLLATGYTLRNGSGQSDATPNITVFSR
jgi:hypothetical protein